jgi:peptide deformylase
MTIAIETVELKYYPDPILKTKCHDIDPCDPDLPAVLDKMVAIMLANDGIGLAAPQVGLSWNVFLVKAQDEEPRALVNPRIERFGENKCKSQEGCLSLPSVVAKLEERYENIVISTCMPKSHERIEVELHGAEAIVFQHEYDHLQGLTLFDRMPPVQKMMSRKKYLKNKEKGEKLHQEFIRLNGKQAREMLDKILEEAKNGKKHQSHAGIIDGGSGGDGGGSSITTVGSVETSS